MGVTFEAQVLDVPVTAVRIIGNQVWSGHGGTLVIHDLGTRKKLKTLEIFRGTSIHGIVQEKADNGQILLFGSKALTVLDQSSASLKKKLALPDWIQGVAWLDQDRVQAITAHNVVHELNVNTGTIETGTCTEKCILYSGKVLANDKIVLAGTVFQEVVIWSPVMNQEAEVLHRLQGHEGVIFSIDFHEKHKIICSTSDDRTARLWQIEQSDKEQSEINWKSVDIKESGIIRGHTARVFRCKILDDSSVLTGGEDSLLQYWKAGQYKEPFLTFKAHSGSPIWGLDSNQSVVCTGGGDAGLRIWPLNQANSTVKIDIFSDCIDQVRVVRLVATGHVTKLLALSVKGVLSCFNVDTKSCDVIKSLDNLKDYGLLEVAGSGPAYLADLQGNLMKLNIVTGEIVTKKLHDGKVFSLHLLNDQKLALTCGPGGDLIITENLELRHQLVLPNHSNQHWVSSAATIKNLLLVGDRGGNLFIYDLSEKNCENPRVKLLKHHGRHGISDITASIDPNGAIQVTTLGREGTMKQVAISPGFFLSSQVSSKIPISSLERLYDDQDLMVGFHSSKFVIFSLAEQRSVLNIECGGGHRSWDLKTEPTATFVFVKDKEVFISHDINLNEISSSNIRAPFNPKALCVAHSFTIDDENYVATAGEDVTVSVSKYKEDDCKIVATLHSHISSVKAIASFPLNASNERLFVSGGGRAQLVAWTVGKFGQKISVSQVTSHMLRGDDKRRKKTWKDSELIYDTEVRYTSLVLLQGTEADEYLTVAGCSDGILRVLKLTFDNQKMELVQECDSINHCYLKVIIGDNDSIVTGSTDGIIRTWEFNKDRLLVLQNEESYHQSGINALDQRLGLTVSGGDSGAIAVHGHVFDNMHACQVTGAFIMDESRFLTCSIDQRLSLWHCNGTENELKLLMQNFCACSRHSRHDSVQGQYWAICYNISRRRSSYL